MNQHNSPNTDKKSTTINPGGQDTDGDGKVVKPGQAPGQSHGKGLPENKGAENKH